MHYIFGYGSLINYHSRQRTGATGESFPVKIYGLERNWGFRVDEDLKTTALAVQKASGDCWVNGTVFMVDENALSEFDAREEGYERIELGWDAVELLSPRGSVGGRLWVYVNQVPELPTEEFPIYQSYLDVVMAGCLEYGEVFARDFLNSTIGWQCILDDREEPLYLRAERMLDYEGIDKILLLHNV